MDHRHGGADGGTNGNVNGFWPRLAADQEITALQASGIGLWGLILLVTGFLATGLIWFNNNILRDFNHRVRRLAAEITRKKPGARIEPGVWFKVLRHKFLNFYIDF